MRCNRKHADARLFWAMATATPAAMAAPLSPFASLTLPPASNPLFTIYCMHWLDAPTCTNLLEALRPAALWSLPGRGEGTALSVPEVQLSQVPALKDWLVCQLQTSLLPTLSALYSSFPCLASAPNGKCHLTYSI